jgi:hypothetical protein
MLASLKDKARPNQIDKQLRRHMIWHRVARELLGLPATEPPYPDYISSSLVGPSDCEADVGPSHGQYRASPQLPQTPHLTTVGRRLNRDWQFFDLLVQEISATSRAGPGCRPS